MIRPTEELPSATIAPLWKHLRFISDPPTLAPEETKILVPLLEAEVQSREIKQIRYLLQRSGIKRIKRFEDFDWKFNPKLSREKFMAFGNSLWIDNDQK